MAIHVAPLLPLPLVLVFTIAYVAVMALFYRRLAGVISAPYWRLLLASKAIALAVLLLAILNPSVDTEEPDTGRHRVAVLLDATGSMATRDCDGRRRLDVVKTAVAAPDARFFRQVLAGFEHLDVFLFAGDSTHPCSINTDFDILPGDTDIDGALAHVAQLPRTPYELGAVLLVSDGIDNVGSPLREAASLFRDRGIPVHCVGVGDARRQADVAVSWLAPPDSREKGKPFTLEARISHNQEGPFAAQLTVAEGSRQLFAKTVEFAAGEKSRDVPVELTAFTAGLQTYKVYVEPIANEENRLNNVDFAGVRITEPDRFNILYYSGNLDWDYGFLKRLCESQDRLELDAVIRLGEDSWFAHGVGKDDEDVKGLPSARELHSYHCLVLAIDGLTELDAASRQSLLDFVGNRGGGIIMTGVTDSLPASLEALFPLRAMPHELVRLAVAPLEFSPSRLLGAPKLRAFDQLQTRLKLPPDSYLYRLEPTLTKPAATTAISVRDAGWPVLAAHHYGNGKVAYLNLSDTWKWALASDQGLHDYGQFWGRLIAWIASSSRERLSVRPRASKLQLGSEYEVLADVLDDTYRPDSQAEVSCRVTAPGGREEELGLLSSGRVDGRYVGKFIPREPGEYHLVIRARSAGGEPVTKQADYLVLDRRAESQPSPMAAAQLQNLARATGGKYWDYHRLSGIDELPLSRRLTRTMEQHLLLDSWLILAAVLLLLLPDWYLRRRIGLR